MSEDLKAAELRRMGLAQVIRKTIVARDGQDAADAVNEIAVADAVLIHLTPKASSPEEREITDADIRALHKALGGNGWAYTNYGGDELNSQRDRLEAGVRAIRATPPQDKGSEE